MKIGDVVREKDSKYPGKGEIVYVDKNGFIIDWFGPGKTACSNKSKKDFEILTGLDALKPGDVVEKQSLDDRTILEVFSKSVIYEDRWGTVTVAIDILKNNNWKIKTDEPKEPTKTEKDLQFVKDNPGWEITWGSKLFWYRYKQLSEKQKEEILKSDKTEIRKRITYITEENFREHWGKKVWAFDGNKNLADCSRLLGYDKEISHPIIADVNCRTKMYKNATLEDPRVEG